MYLFRPPVRRQGPRWAHDSTATQKALYRHFRTAGAPVTVLITDGVVTEHQQPTVAQVNAADTVCHGGGENIVTDADAALLIAAGYELDPV